MFIGHQKAKLQIPGTCNTSRFIPKNWSWYRDGL